MTPLSVCLLLPACVVYSGGVSSAQRDELELDLLYLRRRGERDLDRLRGGDLRRIGLRLYLGGEGRPQRGAGRLGGLRRGGALMGRGISTALAVTSWPSI